MTFGDVPLDRDRFVSVAASEIKYAKRGARDGNRARGNRHRQDRTKSTYVRES